MSMKRFARPAITLALSLVLALFSAALTYSAPISTLPGLSGAAFFFQATPTPQVQDKSEIGSTDEIAVMGAVIVFIIFAPIFISRKSWR